MKKIFALATLLTVSLLSVESAQAKQLVFHACREAECLGWYLVKQTLRHQNPEPHGERKLYQVEIYVDERFFLSPNSRPPAQQHLQYTTVKWVNCSTQVPFIADELMLHPDDLNVLYLNPYDNVQGKTTYFNLYWGVCHNAWVSNNIPELAQNLGYPKTLTYRSERISKKALLGTSNR